MNRSKVVLSSILLLSALCAFLWLIIPWMDYFVFRSKWNPLRIFGLYWEWCSDKQVKWELEKKRGQ